MVRIRHGEQQGTPRHDLEDEIGQQVLAALVRASRATVAQWGAEVLAANGRRVDRILELRITDEDGSSQNLAFAIEIVRHAYPRDISAAMWQLKEFLNSVPENSTPVIPMVAAQALSPGAKDLLRENNIAYSCYAQFHHAGEDENDVLEAQRFATGLVQRVLDETASQLKVARKAGRAGVATSNS